MSTNTQETNLPIEFRLPKEIENLGFIITDTKKTRYWNDRSNVYVVTTNFTSLNDNTWKLRFEERFWEDVSLVQLEINGNSSRHDMITNFSIVSKSPSFWLRKTNNEVEKHYDISGDVILKNTELEKLLLELNEIYLKIVCKEGQIEFLILAESNPTKFIESILKFVSCLSSNFINKDSLN